MKKISIMVILATVLASIITGGTWAWLSDSETSANNSLTAYIGTFDLTIDGGNETVTTFTESGVKPGDSGSGNSLLANEGSIPGTISISCPEIFNFGGSGGTEFEDGQGDLGAEAEIAIYLDRNRNGAFDTGDLGLLEDGGTYPYPHTYPTEFQYAAINDWGSQNWDDLFIMNPGDNFDFIARWKVPTATGNDIEGDSVRFDVHFILNQLPETPSLEIDGVVSESAWREWFTDTHTDLGSFDLHFTAYWYADDTNLYLAVKTLTDTTHNPGKRDVVQWFVDANADGLDEDDRTFSFDTRLQYYPVSGQGAWKDDLWELPVEWPEGVIVAADQTEGYRSYEILIPLAELGDPSEVKIQYTVMDYANKHWGPTAFAAINDHPDLGDGFNWFDSTYWRYLDLTG
jgi:predicted ribosomally synthesized peptide with SipW-like signal peptide